MTVAALTPIESPAGGSILRQTLAIFHDSYRELNARKMFWIVLVLSAIVMACFAVVGVSPQGLHIGSYDWETGFIPAKSIYKWVFVQVVVTYWLTWGAIILAIISTASIFPEFLAGGAVDLYISKPISRLRLFITKYLAGMLFALLQVTIFSLLAFFVVGIRGKFWEPRLFLAIPIVMAQFSYLFAVSVFLGTVTRSSIAALLLTILFWAIVFGIDFGEIRLLAFKNITIKRIAFIDKRLADMDAHPEMTNSQPVPGPPATSPTTKPSTSSVLNSVGRMFGITSSHVDPNAAERTRLTQRRERAAGNLGSLKFWHGFASPIRMIAPKTNETADLLDRALITQDEFLLIMDQKRENMPERFRRQMSEQDFLYVDDEVDAIRRSRSTFSVIGSSLVFEGAVILLSAWIFCRRDY
jgi:ABC-type transport system involved in multi-copper enzyme maturation permease subunit